MKRYRSDSKYRDAKTKEEALNNHLTIFLYHSNEAMAVKLLSGEMYINTSIKIAYDEVVARKHYAELKEKMAELKKMHELEYIGNIEKEKGNPESENKFLRRDRIIITPDLEFMKSVIKHGFTKTYWKKLHGAKLGISAN